MVSLTFYGGANEIGGNKILLEDQGTKLYLDFGESFDFGEDFFYEYLAPRTANGLEVYFEFGMVPKLPKLYGKDMLARTDLKYQKSDVDGIIISHPHSDHYGHLQFLDESIPVYMGHGALRILELYKALFPAFYKIGDHDLRLFSSGEKFKVGKIEFEPIHVEHSIPGAYGFIIHTSKGAIVYTGDFRMHGPRKDLTEEFVKKAVAAKPYALICEGTRMGSEPHHNYTEAEVEKKVQQILSDSKGLVLGYFSMANVDRFMSFYHAVVKNKRIMVIDTRLAYLLQNLREKIPALPDVMADKNIRVYFRFSKSCTFCDKDYLKWEREFMPKMITYKEIAKNPKKYFMHMTFYRMMELVYLQPKEADFIYSMSEHFLEGEENEEQRKIWQNWMDHFGIKFHKAHCSGHASRQDLIEFIKKVNPKVLIPVHTQNAKEFKKVHGNVRLPEEGKSIQL